MTARQQSTTCTKVVTVRLPQEDADRAEFIARVEGISINDVFRRSLEAYVTGLRGDADFVERAQALLKRDTEIASQLS